MKLIYVEFTTFDLSTYLIFLEMKYKQAYGWIKNVLNNQDEMSLCESRYDLLSTYLGSLIHIGEWKSIIFHGPIGNLISYRGKSLQIQSKICHIFRLRSKKDLGWVFL